eukprot:TRINITY_DN5138_c0_g1_i1.p1 TRINITY_DN5138_c0_g1~~TRINITY_DN5138_c0_g1_i1.p1  ORF type:complete len:403 (+),score=108.66 TRINITY_DN5138_c0_g1_i1:321-1529(+)
MILFGAPTFTAIADRFQIHKMVLLGCVIAGMITRMGLPIVGSYSFPIVMSLLMFSDYCAAAINPILDRTTLAVLGKERENYYGRQRMWGTIAWGAISTAIGSIVEASDWTGVFFVLHGVTMILFFVLVYRQSTVTTPSKDLRGEEEVDDLSFWGEVFSIILNAKAVTFFFTVTLFGLLNGIMGNYLFIHIRSLGGTGTNLGLCLTIQSVSEIPFFLFSGQIIDKITPQGGFLLASVAWVFRLLGFYFARNAFELLPWELLHGITFGIMYTSAVRIASTMVPPRLSTTIQGLLMAVYFGLGSASGAAIGGLLYENHSSKLFLIGALVATFIFVFYAAVLFVDRELRKDYEYSKLQEEVELEDAFTDEEEEGEVGEVGEEMEGESLEVIDLKESSKEEDTIDKV